MRRLLLLLVTVCLLSTHPRVSGEEPGVQTTVQPPESIVIDGVPAIDPALVDTVARYQQGRSASFASWHPTELQMLISTRFASTSQIHLVANPGGARRQLTFGNEPALGGNFRPGVGDYFTYAADTGGNENYQIFLYEIASGNTIRITDGKSRNGGGKWSHDGTQIVYYSNGRNGTTNDFYIVDLENLGAPKKVFEAPSVGWYLDDWSRDGSKLLLTEYISVNESRLHLLDVASGAIAQLLPAEGEGRGAFRPAIFGLDGTTVIVGSNQSSEFRQLHEVDVSTGESKPLTPDIPWDIDDVQLSPDGSKLAFVANENGAGVLHLITTAGQQALPIPKLPVGSVSGVDWHSNGKEIAFNLNGSSSPSDVYSVNIAINTVARWTQSETGPVNAERFVEPEIITMKSFDDLEISAIVYRPDATRFPGPRPVVISIHGGPEGQSRPGFMGTYNYFLEELGIAIVLPNVRGSAGFGKSFLDLDNGFKREDSVKDIGTVLDRIATDPALDAERVAVRGGSYGGYMSLACMVHYSDRLKCGIDVVGISNFVTFLTNTEDYRRDLRRVEYGDERNPEMNAFLQKISPANQVEKIRKPLLIVQGLNDPRVPETESSQMVKAIREKGGNSVWYLLANNEGHGFRKKENRDYELMVTVQFLKMFLLQ
ncbi:MAG: S9 family peptidase [Verrucomicrobiae bacterium]|nr:S9 family peptidase [Verrucomicrobiae bacterium]